MTPHAHALDIQQIGTTRDLSASAGSALELPPQSYPKMRFSPNAAHKAKSIAMTLKPERANSGALHRMATLPLAFHGPMDPSILAGRLMGGGPELLQLRALRASPPSLGHQDVCNLPMPPVPGLMKRQLTLAVLELRVRASLE